MGKPQCTGVHEDFRSKRNAEITFLSRPHENRSSILMYNVMDDNFIAFTSGTILPIFICCVLPICIVLIVFVFRNKGLAKKTEVLKLAIESGTQIDPKDLMDALVADRKKKTVRQSLLNRLTASVVLLSMGTAVIVVISLVSTIAEGGKTFFYLTGAVMIAVGLGLLIAYFAGRKILATDIDMEGKVAEAKLSAEREAVAVQPQEK